MYTGRNLGAKERNKEEEKKICVRRGGQKPQHGITIGINALHGYGMWGLK